MITDTDTAGLRGEVQPLVFQTYVIDIGSLAIRTSASNSDLALTSALYWYEENSKNYGLDPYQQIIERILPIEVLHDKVATAMLSPVNHGTPTMLHGSRNIDPIKPQESNSHHHKDQLRLDF